MKKVPSRMVLHGDSFQEAGAHATALGTAGDLTYVNGYDDPAILAGQGTLGLEILEQCPGVEAVVCPIGGGGLIAGVALALKSLRPEVAVAGVVGIRITSTREKISSYLRRRSRPAFMALP